MGSSWLKSPTRFFFLFFLCQSNSYLELCRPHRNEQTVQYHSELWPWRTLTHAAADKLSISQSIFALLLFDEFHFKLLYIYIYIYLTCCLGCCPANCIHHFMQVQTLFSVAKIKFQIVFNWPTCLVIWSLLMGKAVRNGDKNVKWWILNKSYPCSHCWW